MSHLYKSLTINPRVELEEFCEFGEDSLEEHFEATLYLVHETDWIGKDGTLVDLSKINPIYAENLLLWCAKYHTENTPYMHTEQYKYLARRVQVLRRKVEVVKRIFKCKK